jgi:hypothetical protein
LQSNEERLIDFRRHAIARAEATPPIREFVTGEVAERELPFSASLPGHI